MPSVAVKFYSLFFKTLLKHKLLNHSSPNIKDGYAPVSRPSKGVPANASFVDGVATKDINIDPLTTLTLRIFLPESALPQELITQGKTGLFGHIKREDKDAEARTPPQTIDHETWRSSYGGDARNGNKREDKDAEARAPPQTIDHETRRSSYGGDARNRNNAGENRRSSWGGELLRNPRGRQDYARLDVARPVIDEGNQLVEAILDADPSSSGHSEASGWQDSINNFAKPSEAAHDRRDGSRRDSLNYRGYIPDFTAEGHKKLPIIVQFHGGGFVTGSKDSAANDIFCRRMAKLCDAIVIAVGYRLALEHKYPAAFDDGFEALCWLAKQTNLADCSKSLGQTLPGLLSNRSNIHRQNHKELIDTFGGSTIVESWLAAHGDPSRCVLLGVSSGANIADFVARKAVQAGKLLEPIKVVAQVLMYPFFIGSVPTHSEIKLANSYFYDKSACILAWKLFFSDGEFTLDHPVANPLVAGREPPLKHMPPTLTVVGELDWMKDRAIAYSESLRKVNLDAPVLEYKDAVHEFATLDFLVKSRQAEACAEDMTIWIKKYISQKGHEFSY